MFKDYVNNEEPKDFNNINKKAQRFYIEKSNNQRNEDS